MEPAGATSDDERAHDDERARTLRIRAELLASTSMHESEQAQRLIDKFMDSTRAAQLPTVELQARTLDGHLVKTGLRGWYLRNDHSVAIGEDGKYYQLTVPGGFMTRLRGVSLQPTPPPLVVGRGGKDGETGDLKDFLNRVLAQQVR